MYIGWHEGNTMGERTSNEEGDAYLMSFEINTQRPWGTLSNEGDHLSRL